MSLLTIDPAAYFYLAALADQARTPAARSEALDALRAKSDDEGGDLCLTPL